MVLVPEAAAGPVVLSEHRGVDEVPTGDKELCALSAGGGSGSLPWAHPEHSSSTSPPPQGFLASNPDLELLLSKISAVNHLLSSLEKKVPTAPCCAWPTPQLINPSSNLLLSCTAMHPQPLPVLRAPFSILPVTASPQSGHLSHTQAVTHHIPISLSSCWQVLMSVHDTVSWHNLELPSPAALPPDTKSMATQCFEVGIGHTVWPWCLCHLWVGAGPGTPCPCCR